LLLTSACGAHVPLGGVDVAKLRERAAASPQSASVQRKLAFAELLERAGDPKRSARQFEAALRLSPSDERLWLLAGIERAIHGEPRSAVRYFAKCLEVASTSSEEDAMLVSEVAAAGLEDLLDITPNFRELIEPHLSRLLVSRSRLSVGA